MKRRTFLSGAVAVTAVGLTGCLDGGSEDEEPTYRMEIQVQNDHDRSYSAEIRATNADGEVVFEESFELAPGTGRSYSEEVPAGEYTIVVDFPGRSTLRTEWDTDQCDVNRVETRVDADGRVFSDTACADRTTTAA